MSELKMTIGKMRGIALAGMLAVAGLVATPAAHADVMLTEASTFISGTQANSYVVFAQSAGKVNVSLADLNWPERLASLSFTFIGAGGKLAELTGPGVLEFDLSAAGMYTAIVSGVSTPGAWDVGMYSFRLGLTPNAPVVPLPPAIGLLLMGLATARQLTRNRHQRPVV